jgi:hypothetical protein
MAATRIIGRQHCWRTSLLVRTEASAADTPAAAEICEGQTEMEYAVVAQKHDGTMVTLQVGFASREDAEDHRVRLSEWKQVWVQPVDILLPCPPEVLRLCLPDGPSA